MVLIFQQLARPRLKKKLWKLLRDPRNFFLDLRRLQPLWQQLNIKTRHSRSTLSLRVQLSVEQERNLKAEFPAFEAFDLVGENWIAKTHLPVAVMVGFNPWKRAFVSEYLHEYRTAYVRGRPPSPQIIKHCENLDHYCFVVWGMQDEHGLAEFTAKRSVPLFRMEDGFIRSADLGSRHTPALSLVLDSQGIYFDASKPSDLENLLNSFDFASAQPLLDSARQLMSLMRCLRVSKYNLGSLHSAETVLGESTRRRILVVGQVEDDASIRYGLSSGWTNLRLIQLAKQENPDAEILYRPHPDVALGFRENSDALESLKATCVVVTEQLVLSDLLDKVDHVYTITSLSGFEALIHGLPVTVIGAPFYAGWGLTDDRTPVPRRCRHLTLEQLFCAAYLLYPRYLTSLNDPVKGCLGAILAVTAHRRQELDKRVTLRYVEADLETLLSSEYWPAVLRPPILSYFQLKATKDFHSALPLRMIFRCCSGEYYQRSMSYLLIGHIADGPPLADFLKQLRNHVKVENFRSLLEDLRGYKRGDFLLNHLAWCREQVGDIEGARQVLRDMAYQTQDAPIQNVPTLEGKGRQGAILRLAQFELRQRRLNEAYQLFNYLLLGRHITGEVFVGLAEIARLRFDFESAAGLLRFFNRYQPAWKSARLHFAEAQNWALLRQEGNAVEALCLACAVNPQFVESVASITDALGPELRSLPYGDALEAISRVNDLGSAIERAKALTAQQRFVEAEQLLLAVSPMPENREKHFIALSTAYSYQGKVQEAKNVITPLLKEKPSVLVHREALRLAVVAGDYQWGKKVLDDADTHGLEVGDIYYRKVLLGVGDIKGSYCSFRRMKVGKTLKAYFGDRYIQSLAIIPKDRQSKLAILGCFGPGDEVRFASLYRKMRGLVPQTNVLFTCDPRLQPMFSRSYTGLDFVPSKRIRSLAWLSDMESIKSLPGSDLHTFLDNKGWEATCDVDHITLTTDILGDVVEGYESFSGEPYLCADNELISKWRERLQPFRKKPLIGLNWRSSITTHSRSLHYVSIEELAPLFEVSDVQFVNLQYDECEDELALLNDRYPGRVLDFKDLDQYNDLEGVAALMCCLDLVIAPATTVAELAGALGRPTFLLSNSSEIHWRKRPGTAVDVWHQSVSHIEGEQIGDKLSLMRAAAHALSRHPLLASYTPPPEYSKGEVLEEAPAVYPMTKSEIEEHHP